jgi:hypothetical protein
MNAERRGYSTIADARVRGMELIDVGSLSPEARQTIIDGGQHMIIASHEGVAYYLHVGPDRPLAIRELSNSDVANLMAARARRWDKMTARYLMAPDALANLDRFRRKMEIEGWVEIEAPNNLEEEVVEGQRVTEEPTSQH